MNENIKFKVLNITATYDLKREFLPILFPNGENTNITPLELMSKYKIKASRLKIDCDVSEVAMYVYRMCYETLVNSEVHFQKNSKNKYEIKTSNDITLRGDTMTSFIYTFKEYLRLCHDDVLDENKCVPVEYITKGLSNNEIWLNYIYDCIEEGKITLSSEIERFIELNHTIGNLCPVPLHFNISRSNFGRWDYWDLTLLSIFNWYKNNEDIRIDTDETNDTSLINMFTGKMKDKAISSTKEWLIYHKTWENYVKSNHFQPFVKGDDLKPILYWEGRSYKDAKPNTLNKLYSLLESSNEMIEARGKIIERILQSKRG